MENIIINGPTKYIAKSVCIAKAVGTITNGEGRPVTGVVVLNKGEQLAFDGVGELRVYSSTDGAPQRDGPEERLMEMQIFLADVLTRIEDMSTKALGTSQASVELTILAVEIESFLNY